MEQNVDSIFGRDKKDVIEQRNTLIRLTQPEDLLRFGMIPEFIGRFPVLATLDELDIPALERIMVEPKNALVKQYKKLLEYENVTLRFAEGAIRAIAKQAYERKVGARGLRAILESVMLEVMFDVPSDPDIKEVVVSEDTVAKGEKPLIVYQSQAESA